MKKKQLIFLNQISIKQNQCIINFQHKYNRKPETKNNISIVLSRNLGLSREQIN